MLIYAFHRYHRPPKVIAKKYISPECACVDDDGQEYDFCYALPETGALGKRFNCSYLTQLKELGLVPESKTIDLASEEMPDPVFVTAFSDNHWDEAKRMQMSLVRLYWPKQRIIIYSLGISEYTQDYIRKQCNVELREFKFKKYPKYVSQLFEYRWKPIIIAETLNEFGAIWYMDSSITFKKADLSHVYQLVTCRRNQNPVQPLPSIAQRDIRENTTAHESGWDQKQWQENVKDCRKAAYLFHGYTGHGIYPATSQHVYQYFPTNFKEITKPKAKMYEAGFIFAVKTSDTVEGILKWYVLCALEDSCMAPRGVPGISLGCQFGKDRFSSFAKCHRYDQSIVNLLAANANHYDRHYYVSEIVDFFNVVRGPGLPYKLDLSCDVKN
ncbi:unnamed protein product, partial [Mesorhabditis spiculigera]